MTGGSGAFDLPQRVGCRDDGNAVIGFEIAQVSIPRDYAIGLRCQGTGEHRVVGGVFCDYGRDACGSDDHGEGRVTVKDFADVERSGLKLPGELLAREHAAQFGEQRHAGTKRNGFCLRCVDQPARRPLPQQT